MDIFQIFLLIKDFLGITKKVTVFCRLVAKGRELDTKLKELEAQAEVIIEAETPNTR